MKTLIAVLIACSMVTSGCNPKVALGKNFNDLTLSGCLHCGDTWNWKESKSIQYSDTNGMFPLGKECFDKMTYPYVLWYHLKLFDDWGRPPTDKQIERVSFEIGKSKQGYGWAISLIKEKMYENGKLISLHNLKERL